MALIQPPVADMFYHDRPRESGFIALYGEALRADMIMLRRTTWRIRRKELDGIYVGTSFTTQFARQI
jgi:hypothetical protein